MRPITTAELGLLLRRLHALPLPPAGVPTALDPVAGVRRSVDASAILGDDDRELLVRRLEDLAPVWETAMPFGSGLIQSDPQVRNALRRDDGTPVLADWDSASTGPRMWDIATVAVHCRRFGSHDFGDFVTAYGRDPRDWDSFEELCLLRELQMIATNARKSAPGSPAAAEVHHRIAGLREDLHELTAWSILTDTTIPDLVATRRRRPRHHHRAVTRRERVVVPGPPRSPAAPVRTSSSRSCGTHLTGADEWNRPRRAIPGCRSRGSVHELAKSPHEWS